MASNSRLYDLILDWLQAEKPGNATLCDFERMRREVQPGDALLIDGRTRLDSRIKAITSSRWSRVLLYLGRLHDIQDPALRSTLLEFLPCEPHTQLLVEYQVDRGVVLLPMASIELEHIRICRPHGLKPEETQQLIRYCVSRVGKQAEASWMDLIKLMFIPWHWFSRSWRVKLMTRFAGRLLQPLLGSLVAEAYAFIQHPILPLAKHQDAENVIRIYRLEPNVTYAMDFDHSPYFSIVKYPFINVIEEKEGHMFPWRGDTEKMINSGQPAMSLVESQAYKSTTLTDEDSIPRH